MPELTLESLAKQVETMTKRVETIEGKISFATDIPAKEPRKKDWRRTIGMFAESEFMADVFAEAAKIREADREAGRNRVTDEPL